MPRQRNPNRDKAYQIWLEHNGNITNRKIAELLDENEKVIAVWKQRDKWNVVQQTDKSCTTKKRRGAPKGNKNGVGHGAPLGNKNALGNPGGGAPLRNTNAVKTGEYQSLWMDALTPEEAETLSRIDLNPLHQADEEIRLLAWREREMMMRIKKLKEGLTEKQRRILQERQKVKDIQAVHDEQTGQTKMVPVSREELVIKEIEEIDFRPIEDILRIEEALTRVQDKKLKAIELKHRLQENGNASNADDWVAALKEVARRRREKGKGNE